MFGITLEKARELFKRSEKLSEKQFLEVCQKLAKLGKMADEYSSFTPLCPLPFTFIRDQIDEVTRLLVERQAQNQEQKK